MSQAKNQLHIGLVDNRIAVIYVLNQECDNEYKNGNWKYKHEPFYIIHRLCVNPIFQNQGIAKTTLMHIEEEVRALGIHSIRLDVFSENPFALKLYHHYGYSKTGDVNWRKGKASLDGIAKRAETYKPKERAAYKMIFQPMQERKNYIFDAPNCLLSQFWD